ncbi:type I-F CRISPR-associated protein Csy2 [Salmonella enterica subsp. enterica serovar Nigeria]|nr:type I-F CRISPR-associated protein Csy2 [Salmonella enterica subsp. enterica serovar Nigeria]
MSNLIIIRNIRVEYANSAAGLTYGFPAITAFLGFTHALSRKLSAAHGVTLHETAVIAYECQQLTTEKAYEEYRFNVSRNPLRKSGDVSPFNGECKMHMTISLLIKSHGSLKFGDIGAQQLADEIAELIPDMRIAGGLVVGLGRVKVTALPEDEKAAKRIGYSLLPGFALTLNALPPGRPEDFLRIAALEVQAMPNGDDGSAEWRVIPYGKPGYLVPLMVGYRAVSPVLEPGAVKEARDQSKPFSFVEPVHAVGEWRSPHRVQSLDEIFWRYETAPGYYLCRSGETPEAENDFSDINFFE